MQTRETVMEPSLEWVKERLFEVGSTLPMPHSVRELFVSYGTALVPPLIEVMQDRSLLLNDAPGEGYAPIHAVVILGELRATAAIPAMLEFLIDPEHGDLAYEELCCALIRMGPALIEPVLEAHTACTLPRWQEELEFLLVDSNERDPRILALLVGALERSPIEATEMFMEYGDPAAIEPLSCALDDLLFDEEHRSERAASTIIHLAGAIEHLGGALTVTQKTKRALARDCYEDPFWLPAAPARRARTRPKSRSRTTQRKRKRRKQQRASRKKNRR